jgi:hypothetical protein
MPTLPPDVGKVKRAAYQINALAGRYSAFRIRLDAALFAEALPAFAPVWRHGPV